MEHMWVLQTEANHQEREVTSKYQATICFPVKGANGNVTTTTTVCKRGWDSEAIMNLKNERAFEANNLNIKECRPSWERRVIARARAGTRLTTLGSAISRTPIHKKSVVIYHSVRN